MEPDSANPETYLEIIRQLRSENAHYLSQISRLDNVIDVYREYACERDYASWKIGVSRIHVFNLNPVDQLEKEKMDTLRFILEQRFPEKRNWIPLVARLHEPIIQLPTQSLSDLGLSGSSLLCLGISFAVIAWRLLSF